TRRHILAQSRPELAKGACFYSVQQDAPARIDFYRARVVDRLGQTVHERMFALQLTDDGACSLLDPSVLGDLTVAPAPGEMPTAAFQPEPTAWLHEHALQRFLDDVR